MPKTESNGVNAIKPSIKGSWLRKNEIHESHEAVSISERAFPLSFIYSLS